jgi:hypothetical protein
MGATRPLTEEPRTSGDECILQWADEDISNPKRQLAVRPTTKTKSRQGPRWCITAKVPKKISYRGHFDVAVAADPREIALVVLLRSDQNTHRLTTGDRYVKLAFGPSTTTKAGCGRAPKLAAQAVPAITCSSSWTGTACRAWAGPRPRRRVVINSKLT